MGKRATVVVATLVTVVGLCVWPHDPVGAATGATHSAAVPAGWRTYSYRRAEISVPPDWTVVTATGCPVHSAQGILALGAPTRLTNCPDGVPSVVVAAMSPGDKQARAGCTPIRVNGRQTFVLPCSGTGSRGIVQYLVPSLGIQAVGSGTAGEDVSGPGESTVVGKVLHTLR